MKKRDSNRDNYNRRTNRRSKNKKHKKNKGKTLLAVFIILFLLAILTIGLYILNNLYVDYKKGMEEETTEITTETTTSDEFSEEKLKEAYAKEILSSMSLEDKINQLFIITPEALTGTDVVMQAANATKDALKEHPVGGLIYFTQNFTSAEQTKTLLSNTKKFGKSICKVPLYLSVDEEGGSVARFGNSTAIDTLKVGNMSDIGVSGDKQKAYEAGKVIGGYLKEYGFNLDFAPVADVLTNPENQVVSQRSFGSDSTVVSEMSYELAKALDEQGIYSCYKHFPGHGATKEDTHEGFASTDKTYEQLEQSELIPFKNAIKNNADFIMVGHISVPNVIGDNTPSSISSVMVNDILKEKLGYKGLVITDALNMGALTKLYKSDVIAVKAVNAGVDILLMPEDFNLAYEGVKNAVLSGEITEERIDESVEKIIYSKLKMM